jgi:Ca2+-binding EF-hand superfamily protein
MSLTTLQKAKLKRMFDVYDRNHDGFIERSDYEAVIASLAAARKLPPGSDVHRTLEASYLGVWVGLRSHADRNRDSRVTFDEMSAYNVAVMSDTKAFQQQVLGLASVLVDLFDSDGDGAVTETEYREFARCLQFDPGPASFKKLDGAGSGKLSKAALMDRVREFYLSDDAQAGGNWLFGEIPRG